MPQVKANGLSFEVESFGNESELLKNVTTPTLVIHGAADPLVNVEAGKDTAASIPGARLRIIEHMGHDVPPKLVPVLVREIADFASEIDAKA
jgi:pimeloyl-ACP methyl ester carboxylesterase